MGAPMGFVAWAKKLWAESGTTIAVGGVTLVALAAATMTITGAINATSNITTNAAVVVTPATTATGFDARPAVTYDGTPGACWDASPIDGGAAAGCIDAGPSNTYDAGTAPTPVVVAGSVSMLESAWDINDKVARTIGWRLKTEGAAGDSSNAPSTKLLIQSTADNSTWTTRATLDMAGLLAVTGAITGTTGTFSGDIEAAGGYRFEVDTPMLSDIPASGSKVNYNYPGQVRAGSVTGLICSQSAAITAGTVTCSIVCSPACTGTGPQIVFVPTDLANARRSNTVAKDALMYNASTAIGTYCAGSADLAPATVDYSCHIELEQ